METATHIIVVLLLCLLAGTAIAVLRMRELWAAVMLTGIYSFLGAGWMLILDAPDVAFTEAAVGAGISTFLMLSTLALTRREAKPWQHSPILPASVVILTGAALVYGTVDMPRYGDPSAPVHRHLAPEYLKDEVPRAAAVDLFEHLDADHNGQLTKGESHDHAELVEELLHEADANHDGQLSLTEFVQKRSKVGVPNDVTAVLASYRGYDTLGETVVIFTAGIGVLLLLRGAPAGRREEDS